MIYPCLFRGFQQKEITFVAQSQQRIRQRWEGQEIGIRFAERGRNPFYKVSRLFVFTPKPKGLYGP